MVMLVFIISLSNYSIRCIYVIYVQRIYQTLLYIYAITRKRIFHLLDERCYHCALTILSLFHRTRNQSIGDATDQFWKFQLNGSSGGSL